MFHPSEVELGETTKTILAEVERIKPTRVVFDSLSELRLLAGNAAALPPADPGAQAVLRRPQLHRAAARRPDQRRTTTCRCRASPTAWSLLEQLNPEYGAERRRLRVVKYRGVAFRGGYHDYVIQRGGLEVFPRLVAAEHRQPVQLGASCRAASPELDALLGGGLERGTSTLSSAPPGTGKSSLAAQFAAAAAERGEHAAMFIFDESIDTLLTRADGLGIDLREHVDAGRVDDPAGRSRRAVAGRVRARVRQAVEERRRHVVVIDSLNGYLNAMPEERFLIIQLHELLTYLGQHGVATLLVGAQHGLIGTQMTAPVDASYLADAVILLRYFEAAGEVRQAISVVKKRGGAHERTIREFRLDDGGIQVGEPLREFRGVLTGVPIVRGSGKPLAEGRDAHGDARRRRRPPEHARAGARADGQGRGADDRACSTDAGHRVRCCRRRPRRSARELDAGAGAVLLAEEALARRPRTCRARGCCRASRRGPTCRCWC